MITNRKTRWFVALIGVMLCAVMFLFLQAQRAGASQPPPVGLDGWLAEHPQKEELQSVTAEQFVVNGQSCQDIYFLWSDIPASKVPIFSQTGSLLISCTGDKYFYREIYREHDFSGGLVSYLAYFMWSNQLYGSYNCHVFAAVPYVYPPDMTTVYWKHLDSNPEWTCRPTVMPLIMRPYFTSSSTGCGEGDESTQAGDPCEPYPAP